MVHRDIPKIITEITTNPEQLYTCGYTRSSNTAVTKTRNVMTDSTTSKGCRPCTGAALLCKHIKVANGMEITHRAIARATKKSPCAV